MALELLQAAFALLIYPGFVFLLLCAWAVEWIDRRVTARLQGRIGPPWYQPLADWIKLMAKEDLLPEGAHRGVCTIAPMASLAAVLAAGLYIPVGRTAANSFEGDLIVVLFLLSIPALAYFLAGWVTGGVYSVIGGNRSLLQYFSYEVPFLMALSGPAILSGSWSIAGIAARQSGTIWGVFDQPVGFVLAIVGLIGKLQFFSYCFIPLSVGMFPHLFQHWLTAKSAKSFRLTVVAHPLFIMIVWIPCILIGIWGAAHFGEGVNPNAVLGRMVKALVHSPILTGLVGAGQVF